jgi:hypothetical protein
VENEVVPSVSVRVSPSVPPALFGRHVEDGEEVNGLKKKKKRKKKRGKCLISED